MGVIIMPSMGRLSKPFGRVVAAEILDARQDAARIRADARREAQAIEAEALRAAHALRAAAEQEGAARGGEAARADLCRVVAAALAEAERIQRAAVPSARKLAVRMAEKIIGHTLTLAPALLDEMTERALAASGPRSGSVVIRLHPDDYARMVSAPPAPQYGGDGGGDGDSGASSASASAAAGAGRLATLARRASQQAGKDVELWIVADAAVDRFGCIVDTASGRLDARVRTQLSVLEQAAFPAADFTAATELASATAAEVLPAAGGPVGAGTVQARGR
jgi:flagellar biosynthesis/type III secretory pathway protein FliH